MTTESDIFATIKRRCSVRTYTDTMPSADILAAVCEGRDCLHPLDAVVVAECHVASYGFVKGRPGYIAVTGSDAVRAGLEGEQAVLELTAQGYGTCWLGGTFKRDVVRRALPLGEDVDIHAVIAVGTPTGRRRLMEHIIRLSVNESSRKPVGNFILDGTPDASMTDALEAVRLAPSARNCQPWRFIFSGNGSAFLYVDPTDKYALLDGGIAATHFLAMRPDYVRSEAPAPREGLIPVATFIPRKS